MTAEPETLLSLLETLVRARWTAATLKKAVDACRREWEEEHAAALQELGSAEQALAEAERRARERALTEFRETGDTKPAPGVAIRMMTRLEYDRKEAFRWAEHHRMALKLDTAAFEKIAKASSIAEMPFVELRQEPQVTIATDLAAAVEAKA